MASVPVADQPTAKPVIQSTSAPFTPANRPPKNILIRPHPTPDEGILTSTASAAKVDISKDGEGHKRAYKACYNCRNQKVKCVPRTADVDAPKQPCMKCLREGKDCTMPEERSKKHGRDTKSTQQDGDEARSSPNKRRRRSPTESATNASMSTPSTDASTSVNGELLDALPFQRQASLAEPGHTGSSEFAVLAELSSTSKDVGERQLMDYDTTKPGFRIWDYLIDRKNVRKPFLHENEEKIFGKDQTPSQADKDRAAKAWKRFYFCRGALPDDERFNFAEAIYFVERFYLHLAPLTPVTGLFTKYAKMSEHEELLGNHPILALAILTISSRYFEPTYSQHFDGPPPPSEPKHATSSRARGIHSALWRTVCSAIQDLTWVRGDVGTGILSIRGIRTAPVSPRACKIRSLSTILALLLLTEWYPRDLHRPQPNHMPELMLPDLSKENADQPSPYDSSDNFSDWYEACMRSGRLAYIFTTVAFNIACELGLWSATTVAEYPSEEERAYAKAVASTLYVYMQNASFRFQLTSFTPPLPDHLLEVLTKTTWIHDGETDPHPAGTSDIQDVSQETFYHWHQIVSLVKEADVELYTSEQLTRVLINDESYRKKVDSYDRKLAKYSKELSVCRNLVIRNQRRILNLELQYYRIHILSIALQAAWTRVVNQKLSDDGFLRPAYLHYALKPDRELIHRIFAAGCSFLETVLTFVQDGGLRYIPAHSFLRIVIVSFQLIKCFYMGLNSDMARRALAMIELTSQAVYSSPVDRDHIGSRVAHTLRVLASMVKKRLARLPLLPMPKVSFSEETSPYPTSADTPAEVRASVRRTVHDSADEGTSPPSYSGHAVPISPPNPHHAEPHASRHEPNADIRALDAVFAEHSLPSTSPTDSAGTWDPLQTVAALSPNGFLACNAVPVTLHDSASLDGNDPAEYPSYFHDGPPKETTAEYWAKHQAQQDWTALPLQPLFDAGEGAVVQGPFGPLINGNDPIMGMVHNGSAQLPVSLQKPPYDYMAMMMGFPDEQFGTHYQTQAGNRSGPMYVALQQQ